jgi:hypothetical protein
MSDPAWTGPRAARTCQLPGILVSMRPGLRFAHAPHRFSSVLRAVLTLAITGLAFPVLPLNAQQAQPSAAAHTFAIGSRFVPPRRQALRDPLRRNPLPARPPGILAATAEDVPRDGTQHRLRLPLLELLRAGGGESSTGAARPTSPSFAARPRRRASGSFSVPAPTRVPSGKWAAFPGGC